MVDPVSFVVSFLTTVGVSAGKVVTETALKKYSEGAIAKVNGLLGKLWERLRQKNPKAEQALQGLEQSDPAAPNRLQTYLLDAMEDDPDLQALVEELAREIEAGQQVSTGGINQHIAPHGKGVAIYSQNEGGTTNNAGIINNNIYTSPGQH